ncbi:MAG: hypothetical protein LBI86_03405 [Treponema sp.]|jgi:hypothetical protein|nr:hypothetical protein [Treponema sp.]
MKDTRLRNIRFLGLFLLAFPFFSLSGAEITVPRLELATRGRVNDDGEFALSTNALADIALDGGYKFGVRLGLSFTAADLGKAFAYRNLRFLPLPSGTAVSDVEYNSLADQMNGVRDNDAALSFRFAGATARDLFSLPLELSYFIGHGDTFGSGEEFAARYGLFQIPTDFTGFYYFPDGIDGDINRRYEGIYQARGTGLSFALTRWNMFVPMVYVYQNLAAFEDGTFSFAGSRYSGDLRLLFNRNGLSVEAFGGITGGKDPRIQFRGGVLAFFSSGAGTDFLLQAGIPGWEKGSEFGADHLFFLIEPRLRFGIMAFHMTFFYHPLVYQGVRTNDERGRADINFKIIAGDPVATGIQGGIENTIGVKLDDYDALTVRLSPFVSFISGGLQWNVKLRVNVMDHSTPYRMFEVFAGIRTAY